MPVIILALAASAGVLAALALATVERAVPHHDPDLPPDAPPPAGFPRSTGYRLVDKILSLLKQAADSSGIPLGVLVGWIAKESGGRIGEKTSLGELGYFQLISDEQVKTGYTDKGRLSADPMYSINAGLALIGVYMGVVERLGVAARGSEYFWRLVKLAHSMGSGSVQKIVVMAQAAGAARTWARLEEFALEHDAEIKSATKHSPAKWFPFVDEVARVGAPFGFGSSVDTVVGGEVFTDIVDPLDALS